MGATFQITSRGEVVASIGPASTRPDLRVRRATVGATVLSSLPLETELRRLAVRTGLLQERVSDLLDRIDLVELDAVTCRTAGLLDGAHLRSSDALHIASALRTNCQTMISYDARRSDAARRAGLHVVSPQ